MLSSEIRENFKNTYFEERMRTAASVLNNKEISAREQSV